MFARGSTIKRYVGEAALTFAAAVCVLAVTLLALILTLALAAPLNRPGDQAGR